MRKAVLIPLARISCITGEHVEQGAGHSLGRTEGLACRKGIFRRSFLRG
jgi:hypothetical protein